MDIFLSSSTRNIKNWRWKVYRRKYRFPLGCSGSTRPFSLSSSSFFPSLLRKRHKFGKLASEAGQGRSRTGKKANGAARKTKGGGAFAFALLDSPPPFSAGGKKPELRDSAQLIGQIGLRKGGKRRRHTKNRVSVEKLPLVLSPFFKATMKAPTPGYCLGMPCCSGMYV